MYELEQNNQVYPIKLSMFLTLYESSSCITIKKGELTYCEEKRYDYYIPVEDETGSITEEPWWDEVKHRSIEKFTIIGGYDNYPVELVIFLR